jgi:tungstate transport system permease protein
MVAMFSESIAMLSPVEGAPWEIVWLSIRVSGLATILSCLIGFPLGAAVALARFRGRVTVMTTLNAAMGLPPVLVGLCVYLALSRSGPMGSLGLLFTPTAMVIAQTCLIMPLVAALAKQTVEDADERLGEQLRSMKLSLVDFH